MIQTEDNAGVKTQIVKGAWGAAGTVNLTDNATNKRLPINLAESALLPAALGPGGGLKIEDVGTINYYQQVTLQASQTAAVAAGTTTRTTTTGLGIYTMAIILINITAGGTAGTTLQLFLQDSIDGGTTWNDLVSSNTFTAGSAGTTQVFSLAGLLATSQAQGSAQTLETMTAGQARTGPWGDRIRVREKITGSGGTGITYVISAVFHL